MRFDYLNIYIYKYFFEIYMKTRIPETILISYKRGQLVCRYIAIWTLLFQN